MLGVSFKELILNKYGSYHVANNGYTYINYDLTDKYNLWQSPLLWALGLSLCLDPCMEYNNTWCLDWISYFSRNYQPHLHSFTYVCATSNVKTINP